MIFNYDTHVRNRISLRLIVQTPRTDPRRVQKDMGIWIEGKCTARPIQRAEGKYADVSKLHYQLLIVSNMSSISSESTNPDPSFEMGKVTLNLHFVEQDEGVETARRNLQLISRAITVQHDVLGPRFIYRARGFCTVRNTLQHPGSTHHCNGNHGTYMANRRLTSKRPSSKVHPFSIYATQVENAY